VAKVSLGVYPNGPAAEIIASVKLAEDLGFHTLWMLDSHLLFREVYTLLGALAARTQRIRLGTAVTNPLTRHPTVTASAFATLSELSGGRATLGISVGDSALKAMNLDIARMATLEDAVVKCRALLRGEEVSFAEAQRAKLRHIAPEVPIYVAATGPKMLSLAGRIADGVILMNGVAPDFITAASAIVREGERQAGRADRSTRLAVWAACHPDVSAVRFNVARAILREIPGPRDDATQRVAEKVRETYDYDEHGASEARFASLVPTELVRRYAFSGSPSEVKEQIDALSELGVDEVILAIPVGPGLAARDEVMPPLAAAVITRAPEKD
jgi:5,10-methylenetetrahydromethanopterin reductase